MNKVDYLNKTIWCKIAPSSIHGVGVFAIRDIPKGQRLSDYEFDNLSVPRLYLLSEAEFELLLPEIKELILDRILIPEELRSIPFLSPNCNQILQSFMNHSSHPNSDGLKAIKDIKKGEEVTEDYHILNSRWHSLTKNRMSDII